jgi:NH3-dependent NAD+ synthetase
MPGFATGETTKSYATRLMQGARRHLRGDRHQAGRAQMLADLDHPFAEGEPVYDVTFENVQAGLRTDYLFRLANHRGGIVLGTGDLSELALGWCTYGVGDQMSHYNVNAGVPKTLIQHLIRWVIDTASSTTDTNETLGEILDQEITPELIPTEEGRSRRPPRTRSGPTRCRTSRSSTCSATATGPARSPSSPGTPGTTRRGEWPPGFPATPAAYDLATIRRWLEVFVKRFFASQFKRSALPNGPKVSAGGTMSPRGDWRMPAVRRHGQAGRLRAPRARGARRPVRAAVVHRRARLPEVGRGRAGRARGRVRRGHRLRRLGDRGLRPRLRVRHARQARPVDVPDPAVARRDGPSHGPDVLRHPDARRLPVVRRPAARAQADAEPRPPTSGFTFYTHPEIEFYLFKDTAEPGKASRCRSTAAATSTTPPSRSAHDFRREAITMLEAMGISVEFSHHEGGPGQQEIDLRYADALSTADNIMTFRTVIRRWR